MTEPASALRIHRLADTGILIEVENLDAVLRLDEAVRGATQAAATQPVSDSRIGVFSQVIDVLPAAETLMLTVAAGADLAGLEAAVRALDLREATASSRAEEVVEIPVIYDGPDLDEVADRTGLTRTDVVAAHTGTPWRSAFGGFAPGFFYLVDGDPRLEVPRRQEPRTAVPDGAVALAGTYSAVYPRTSPGGWQLIGHTEQRMWDSKRTPPALLAPGVLVRFVDAGGTA